MSRFIDTLLTNNFMPHGHCYFWRPDVLWLHVGSNAIIAIAYFVIPIALYTIIKRSQRPIPHKDLLYLFITFITFCGLSHSVEILTTWIPLYQLEGWVKATTASISIITALVLLPKLPDLLTTQSLQEKYDQLYNERDELEEKLNQMNSVYRASLGREERILQLKIEINSELTKQGFEPRYKIYEGSN